LLHTKPTSARTWFFIDELHNLKRLPRIESSLAEVRKFGGCYVIGTQMVSQLNKIYGHEIAKTITGLCDTKIVMRGEFSPKDR
jgi:type IV secretory pathway TraG/TraD family ATPase VirD4